MRCTGRGHWLQLDAVDSVVLEMGTLGAGRRNWLLLDGGFGVVFDVDGGGAPLALRCREHITGGSRWSNPGEMVCLVAADNPYPANEKLRVGGDGEDVGDGDLDPRCELLQVIFIEGVNFGEAGGGKEVCEIAEAHSGPALTPGR